MYENEDIILGKLRTNREQLENIVRERLADYGVYDGGLLVEAQGTPNMTVKVSAGVIYMPTTFTRYSIAATASLAVTAADATNPRYDIIYISSAGVVSYLAGAATASPTIPTTPSGAVKLAEIYVTAGKTSIVAGDIFDRRKFLIWGATYEATLQNGWSGHLYYRKNIFGQVNIFGELTIGTGTFNTIFATLPSGYYSPSIIIPFLGSSLIGGSNTNLVLTKSGEFRNYIALTTGRDISINILISL